MAFSWNIVVVTLMLNYNSDISTAIRNLAIQIEPSIVERGGTAVLQCHYDLENKPLYQVKWYRGEREFYRYAPKEEPNTKIFHFAGLEVNLGQSNRNQVVLEHVEFNLSGKFTCEVSTDEPNFLTAVGSRNMSVVVFPQHPPSLTTEMPYYNVGDIVRLNCSSSPSKPAADLVVSVNNVVITTLQEHTYPVSEDLWISQVTSEFTLTAQFLKEDGIYLHCLAQVTNLYQEYTSLRLDAPKDPVPERVTSQNAGELNGICGMLLTGQLVLPTFCLRWV